MPAHPPNETIATTITASMRRLMFRYPIE
jgi:hypothetical protein